jgi:hypothetical protein
MRLFGIGQSKACIVVHHIDIPVKRQTSHPGKIKYPVPIYGLSDDSGMKDENRYIGDEKKNKERSYFLHNVTIDL